MWGRYEPFVGDRCPVAPGEHRSPDRLPRQERRRLDRLKPVFVPLYRMTVNATAQDAGFASGELLAKKEGLPLATEDLHEHEEQPHARIFQTYSQSDHRATAVAGGVQWPTKTARHARTPKRRPTPQHRPPPRSSRFKWTDLDKMRAYAIQQFQREMPPPVASSPRRARRSKTPRRRTTKIRITAATYCD